MEIEADYITADYKSTEYVPFPLFLLKLDISRTAMILYALLLGRVGLSQKNGWIDESGRVYIIYSVSEMAEAMGLKDWSIRKAIGEIKSVDLLTVKRTGRASVYYVRRPVREVCKTTHQIGDKSPIRCVKNHLSDRCKTTHQIGDKSPIAHTNKELKEEIIYELKEECVTRTHTQEEKKPFGKYKNILLTDSEYAELEKAYPGRITGLVEKMSSYLAANGKEYRNYAAALDQWAKGDAEKDAKTKKPKEESTAREKSYKLEDIEAMSFFNLPENFP